jgi:type IV secretory pathway VirJ component
MKRWHLRLAFFALLGSFGHAHASARHLPAATQTRVAPFGFVTLYKPARAEPDSVALFVSGDGGWNLGVVSMARALADSGALVIGIDVRRFLAGLARSKANCQPLAVDFELLSHQVQKQAGVKEYHVPTLVGYSSGATVVYATLAQAPAGTFAGAISMGFCPDQDFGGAKLCPAPQLRYTHGKNGALVFEPAAHLEHPWIALQGQEDAVCSAQVVDQFVAHTGGGAVVHLPRVGHGFSVERNWLPQLLAAYKSIAARAETTAAQVPEIQDLPVTTVRATARETDTFALLLTGDGGWAGLDRELAARLAERGISTVGFNSLRYFWHLRTPEEAARDVARVLEHFLSDWKKARFILIGYSFGADAAPFIVNRLPEQLRLRLLTVSLLGIESDADFEVSVADWIPGSAPRGRAVRPELAAINVPVLCIYGEGESTTICPSAQSGRVRGERIGSGHHFGGDYADIADHILAFASIMSHHN